MSNDQSLDIWHHYFEENSGLWLPLQQRAAGRDHTRYDDVILLAKDQHVQGEDAEGEVGTYTATFRICPNPSTDLEIELGVRLNGKPLITIDSNYAGWPNHQRLRVRSLGIRDNGATTGPGIIPYVLADGTLHFRPLRQRVRYSGARAYGEILWRGDLGLTSVHHFDPAGKFEDLRPAWDALREFDGISPPKPGPKPGTVERAKYKSREEWHAALRTVALAKPIQTQIPTQIIEVVANRLSIGGTLISPTTVRRYMERYGPKTPEELRNGKWECACHSCRP